MLGRRVLWWSGACSLVLVLGCYSYPDKPKNGAFGNDALSSRDDGRDSADAGERDAAAPPHQSTPPADDGVKHPACGSARPRELPPPPLVARLADGRPAFDAWRDRSCESTWSVPVCAHADEGHECEACLWGDKSLEQGVCTSFDSDVWCDGEGQIVTSRSGACRICAPDEARARACCKGYAGFDCRAWPYDADGEPGEACARHEDCSPGLVCKADGAWGYGLCLCPEVSVEQLRQADDCWTSI